jgi:hypothetical protein
LITKIQKISVEYQTLADYFYGGETSVPILWARTVFKADLGLRKPGKEEREKRVRVDDILNERLRMSGWKGWKDF